MPRLAAATQHDPELLSLRAQLQNTRFAHARIIERHLYGVDLDPQAAEIASMNLLLKALTRDERLPRILGDNIKVGNSLISGMPLGDVPKHLEQKIIELRELREAIHAETLLASDNTESRAKHEAQIDAIDNSLKSISAPLNSEVNESLRKNGEDGWFLEVEPKHPFNWQIEFPEIFFPKNGRTVGFTFVLGNPPYVGFHGKATMRRYRTSQHS